MSVQNKCLVTDTDKNRSLSLESRRGKGMPHLLHSWAFVFWKRIWDVFNLQATPWSLLHAASLSWIIQSSQGLVLGPFLVWPW